MTKVNDSHSEMMLMARVGDDGASITASSSSEGGESSVSWGDSVNADSGVESEASSGTSERTSLSPDHITN